MPFQQILPRSLCLMLALGLCAETAAAQESTQALQDALKRNDAAAAMALASDLYSRSEAENDHTAAGFAAYVKAGLLEQDADFSGAAKAYADCADHYESLNSAAQSIQCEYSSGLAHLSAYQDGKAMSALKSTARRLEAIGQDRSAMASKVYLTLAEETLPPKTQRGAKAQGKRLEAAAYADKSMRALTAAGQNETEFYAAAAFMKGMALDDAEDFPEAVKAYETAIRIYAAQPNTSPEELKSMQARLSIAKFGQSGKTSDNTHDVRGPDGEMITLTIKKKRKVRVPRINNNQMVDGARARAQITLGADGRVASLTIQESDPDPKFGEALEKGMKTWVFTPPEGVAPQDIPPFDYSMIFYVSRR